MCAVRPSPGSFVLCNTRQTVQREQRHEEARMVQPKGKPSGRSLRCVGRGRRTEKAPFSLSCLCPGRSPAQVQGIYPRYQPSGEPETPNASCPRSVSLLGAAAGPVAVGLGSPRDDVRAGEEGEQAVISAVAALTGLSLYRDTTAHRALRGAVELLGSGTAGFRQTLPGAASCLHLFLFPCQLFGIIFLS